MEQERDAPLKDAPLVDRGKSAGNFSTMVPMNRSTDFNVSPSESRPVVTASTSSGSSSTGQYATVLTLAGLVVATGAFNYVLGKIRAKPLGNYDYFVSLFNSIAYTLLYWGILGFRSYSGQVGAKQYAFVWGRQHVSPERRGTIRGFFDSLGVWKYFVLTGLCDSCGNILGFIAQPYVPGAIYSLMNQAIVPFTALVSMLLLNRRYTAWQVLSILTVVSGAVVALIPDLIHPQQADQQGEALMMSIVVALSTLPSALSFAIKEKVFASYAQQHPGEQLDLFIVNSHGSLFGLLWTPLALPLNILFNQTHGASLVDYVRDGLTCFAGTDPAGLPNPQQCAKWSCCKYAPQAYLAYIAVNLAFNIALLALLRVGSALLAFICLKAVLPVSVFLYYLQWPLLEASDAGISPYTLVSLVIILAGVGWFKAASMWKDKVKADVFRGEEPPCFFPWRLSSQRLRTRSEQLDVPLRSQA